MENEPVWLLNFWQSKYLQCKWDPTVLFMMEHKLLRWKKWWCRAGLARQRLGALRPPPPLETRLESSEQTTLHSSFFCSLNCAQLLLVSYIKFKWLWWLLSCQIMASFKVALYAITKQLAGYFIYLIMHIPSVSFWYAWIFCFVLLDYWFQLRFFLALRFLKYSVLEWKFRKQGYSCF